MAGTAQDPGVHRRLATAAGVASAVRASHSAVIASPRTPDPGPGVPPAPARGATPAAPVSRRSWPAPSASSPSRNSRRRSPDRPPRRGPGGPGAQRPTPGAGPRPGLGPRADWQTWNHRLGDPARGQIGSAGRGPRVVDQEAPFPGRARRRAGRLDPHRRHDQVAGEDRAACEQRDGFGPRLLPDARQHHRRERPHGPADRRRRSERVLHWQAASCFTSRSPRSAFKVRNG